MKCDGCTGIPPGSWVNVLTNRWLFRLGQNQFQCLHFNFITSLSALCFLAQHSIQESSAAVGDELSSWSRKKPTLIWQNIVRYLCSWIFPTADGSLKSSLSDGYCHSCLKWKQTIKRAKSAPFNNHKRDEKINSCISTENQFVITTETSDYG